MFDPGTQILLNLIPKLVGLPKFQPKRISKMQFPNILPQLEFAIFPKNPKSQNRDLIFHISDFQGASYPPKRAQPPLAFEYRLSFFQRIRESRVFAFSVEKPVQTPP